LEPRFILRLYLRRPDHGGNEALWNLPPLGEEYRDPLAVDLRKHGDGIARLHGADACEIDPSVWQARRGRANRD